MCIFCWKSCPATLPSLSLPALSRDDDNDDEEEEEEEEEDAATAMDIEVLAAGGEGEVCMM